MELLDFSKTTFGRGLNAIYGKVPIKLELCLDFIADNNSMKLELYIGMDKVYRVSDIGALLGSIEEQCIYSVSKNFIFEPAKMYFEQCEKKIVDFLISLKIRRSLAKYDLSDNCIILKEDELEKLLDLIWNDLGNFRLHRQSKNYSFTNSINIKTTIEKKENFNLISLDYSEYGDFEPLTVSFSYILFTEKNLIVKLPENLIDIIINIFNYKNDENIVCLKIEEKEKKLFQKNFYEKYNKVLKISVDSSVENDIKKNSLIARIYFDMAPTGIVSKIEFVYDEKIINPLKDTEFNNSFREIENEKIVIFELKHYGFKEKESLYFLEDTEKIMNMLTDKLKELKKIAQLYYSEDFKKIQVKNFDGIGLSLFKEDSVIHMNINIEDVSDEELMGLLQAIKKRKKYYRLRNGSIINLASVESSAFVDLINNLDINKENVKDGFFEIPLNRCIYIDNYLKEKGIENVKIDEALGRLIKDISNPQDFEIQLKEPLNSILRSYQILGVKWLKTMTNYSFGGILADDMGLGKTLQVLAFIENEKKRDLPCLVVAPTSVLYNWKIEAQKFTPDLKVLVVSGTKEKRSALIFSCNNYDMLITSYGALKNDVEDYKKVKFSYIFVDEAQNIKNPETINANSVKSLKARACFALTGTPMENRLTDLWSIFDFIMPGFLYNRSNFKNIYEEPIMRDKNKDKMYELSKMTKPFILRRLKKEVLDELPEKIETNYFSQMLEKQKKIYAAYYKECKDEFMANKFENGTEGNSIDILSALTRLRQICAHPGTFIEDYDGGSCKLDMAMEIITEALNTGHSVLLFSQFTRVLKIIRNELEANKVSYHYLDGTMKPEERVCAIDNFNSDKEAVFLISLKAGGTGLNLTKADVVIHFDPWWNPAVEDQASDRAYRMGQKNVVQVYKLLTEGTIEEKIIELQDKKRDLIENIIKPGENFLSKLSQDEIKDLFGLN